MSRSPFVGAHHQADVGHQQHDQNLQEALGVSWSQAAANDQGEQVSAEDAQDAADGGADQTRQADQAQPPFEQDDGDADDRAD